MKNPHYHIEEANLNDQEKIISLVNEANWLQLQPFFIDIPARMNVIQLTKLLNDETQKVFVLKSADIILGVIVLDLPVGEEYAKFGFFAVDQKCSGKRLGRLLIDYIENYAFEQGRKWMKIEVFTFANRLTHYYEQLGYSFTGKVAPFFFENCIKREYQNREKLYLSEMIKILNKK